MIFLSKVKLNLSYIQLIQNTVRMVCTVLISETTFVFVAIKHKAHQQLISTKNQTLWVSSLPSWTNLWMFTKPNHVNVCQTKPGVLFDVCPATRNKLSHAGPIIFLVNVEELLCFSLSPRQRDSKTCTGQVVFVLSILKSLCRLPIFRSYTYTHTPIHSKLCF